MDLESCLLRLGVEPMEGEGFQPINGETLTELEQKLNVRLPESYRDFLLKYGAVRFGHALMFHPVKPLPPDMSSTGEAFFSHFYGPMNDPEDADSLSWMIDVVAKRMPESLIPIGNDGGDNHICLGIRGMEYGKVYFWDHEQEHLGLQNAHLIAESFDDFIGRLYVVEE